MTLEEKYKIHIINGKRHYEFDLTEDLPLLDNTVPYFFKYGDIEIYEAAWNKLSIKLLEELDNRFPHDDDWYLSMRYSWSNTNVFSINKQTNFTKFKDLYLNTNHSSTHAMMSIQYLLQQFGINLADCYFLIDRHQTAEPEEVREYIHSKTINDFSKALKLKKFSDERIHKIVNSIISINKLLKSCSTGFDDFFLFDEYICFANYKIRIQEVARKKYFNKPEKIKAINNLFDYLNDFYKNRPLYEKICDLNIIDLIKLFIDKAINSLFESLNTTTITCYKLFSRLNITHEKIMKKLGEFNNVKSVFTIAEIYFNNKYYFNYPMIAVSKDNYLSNEQIIQNYIQEQDMFSMSDVNDFIDTALLKKPDNYLQLIFDISKDFVQLSMDKFIKKESLNLTNDFLNKLASDLQFYINSFGPINTIKYKGYNTLPSFEYEWNKYSLIGIVRTYLSNVFKIKYIGQTYKTVDFEIDLL